MTADYYKLLKEYISFKSISTDNNYEIEIKKCANRLKDLFVKNNFKVDIIEKYGNPIVIASYIFDINLKTGLVYGHYDVQGADKNDGRKEDPFSLYISKNKIIGRGVVDNKGQTLIHIISILKLIREKKLGYNIIFILEGEEEIGSSGITKFMTTNQESIKSDFILVSDGNILKNNPVIESGFRGGFNAKLEINTANTDLHTGIYGGIVPNSIEELNKLFSKLYDTSNHITIPYFYYEVDDIRPDQKSINNKTPFDEEELKKSFGISQTKLKEIDYYSQSGWKPCIELTGIVGGQTNFFKNAIPNKATANVNFRLVNNQKCESIISLFKEWIKKNLPEYVQYKLIFDSCCNPTKLDLQNNFTNKAEEILGNTYKNKVYFIRSGGSLPIINIFQQYISKSILSIPLGNEDSNIHGVNENFNTDLIEKGLEFSYNFFKK